MLEFVDIAIIFLLSLFAALFVLPKLTLVAHRIGLLDQPDARKRHGTPAPLVGGMGIVMSVTFVSLLFVPIAGFRGYFAGLALLLFTGFFDDLEGVSHNQKFFAQMIATGFLIHFSKVYLFDFGNLLGLGDIIVPDISLAVWGVTIFCVVGVTNALNMIDGLDGLAGGISSIAFFTFAIIALMVNSPGLAMINVGFAGAVLGFLRYNWAPASLFMGDAGSLCLGFSLAFVSIALTQGAASPIAPVIPLLILAIPISDTIAVMTRRILQGVNPCKPDRQHLHYLLVDAGVQKTTAVVFICGLSLLFAVVAICGIVFHVQEKLLFLVFLIYFVANFFSRSLVGILGRGTAQCLD